MSTRLHRFFLNDTATTDIYTLSLHDALPIYLDKEVYIADYEDLGANACRILVPGYSEIYEAQEIGRAHV